MSYYLCLGVIIAFKVMFLERHKWIKKQLILFLNNAFTRVSKAICYALGLTASAHCITICLQERKKMYVSPLSLSFSWRLSIHYAICMYRQGSGSSLGFEFWISFLPSVFTSASFAHCFDPLDSLSLLYLLKSTTCSKAGVYNVSFDGRGGGGRFLCFFSLSFFFPFNIFLSLQLIFPPPTTPLPPRYLAWHI